MLSARIHRGFQLLTILSAALLIAAASATPVLGVGGPPGNNGTVKIDRLEFDDHPNNEPHVGCGFEVDFYGFDLGDLSADVTFEAHPPTGHGVLLTDEVFIGHDDNTGGGSEAGLDAAEEYDLTAALSAFEPHPIQGHHVKLTVHAEGSQGADTKHKVFWVGPCEAPPTNPPGNGGGGGSTVTPPGGGVLGGNPPVRTLPDTSLDAGSAPLTLLAGAALVAGTLAMAAMRRSRAR